MQILPWAGQRSPTARSPLLSAMPGTMNRLYSPRIKVVSTSWSFSSELTLAPALLSLPRTSPSGDMRTSILAAQGLPLLLKSTPLSLLKRSSPHFNRLIGTKPSIRTFGAGSIPEISIARGVTEQQCRVLLAYLDEVLIFNQHTNLTAIRDRDQAIERHIHDSLALLPVLDQLASDQDKQSVRVIDVGTGGGFPGVLLAIARPEWQVWLLDSLRKRCDFVQGALARLGISNAQTLWGRAETLGQDAAHRGSYDVAVARAVADMRVLSELCLPFVRTGGHLVAAKGPDPAAEVAAAKHAFDVLGGRLVDVMKVESLSEEGLPRTAVIVRKDMQTPEEYPRREGKPSKRPL